MAKFISLRRILGLIALAGLLAFAGFSVEKTDVSPGGVVIYGDSQDNEADQRRVVAAVLREKPAIVFRVGDLVSDGNDPEQWQIFNRIHGELVKTTEYFPALGNHEYESPLYFANFPKLNGRRWYSVDRQGIHFVVLDSNVDFQKGSEQYAWLESDLAQVNPDVKFRVVIFHHTLFTVTRPQGGEDEKNLRPILLPLFERYGVSAVFSGHEHNYERFLYDGIPYVVTSGGGSRLRDQRNTSPYLRKFSKNFHFCLMVPGGDVVKVKVLGTNLQLIDAFDIAPFRPAGARK